MSKPSSIPAYDKHAQALADFFIERLKDGTAPWTRPWQNSEHAPSPPYNPTTGKAYRGSNSLLLMCSEIDLQAEGKAHPADNRWMTYKQALSVGAQVKRGEKSRMCISYHEVEDKREAAKQQQNNKEQEPKKRLIAVPFYVFHASQIDGLPPPPEPTPMPEHEVLLGAKAVLDDSGAKIFRGGNHARYLPVKDVIQLPDPEQFNNPADFYAVALHELAHWTGHESRLNRKFAFSVDEDYAREELRAEMSSLAMCQRLGVPHDPSRHSAYVNSWISMLENDPREIVRAAADVEKILKHLKVHEREHEVLPKIEQEQKQEQESKKERSTTPAVLEGILVSAGVQPGFHQQQRREHRQRSQAVEQVR